MKNLEIFIKKGRVEVESKILDRHPLLNQPIKSIKIKKPFIPEKRIPMNKWFKKFEPWNF
jgi:hypothetical protein